VHHLTFDAVFMNIKNGTHSVESHFESQVFNKWIAFESLSYWLTLWTYTWSY